MYKRQQPFEPETPFDGAAFTIGPRSVAVLVATREDVYKRQIEYMNAQDTLAAAEESAASAEIDLFTAYQTYQWARRGVMSSAA